MPSRTYPQFRLLVLVAACATFAALLVLPSAASATAPSLTTGVTVAAAGLQRWPGKVITVVNTLPGQKAEPARRAVADWNHAKVGISFRLVTSRRADVVIKQAARTPCGSAGCGDLGYQPGRQSKVTMLGTGGKLGFDRVGYTMLIAHELGHVLGLGHSSDPKALMYPYPKSTVTATSGRCRHYAAGDLQKLRRRYGGPGSLKLRSSCRFYPATGTVTDVRVTPQDGVAVITWAPASHSGSYDVARGRAGGPCPTDPNDLPADAPSIRIGPGLTASDWSVQSGRTYCYRVFPRNLEGYADVRKAGTLRFTATVPPPPPPTSVGVTLRPGDDDYEFDVTGVADDVEYAVAVGSCPSEPVDSLSIQPTDPELSLWRGDVPAGGRACLRFWRSKQGFGGESVRSTPVDRWVDLPVRSPVY